MSKQLELKFENAKICYRCQRSKSLKDFRRYKNRGRFYHLSYCKECAKEYNREYFEKHPWVKIHDIIKSRCRHSYAKKNIESFLTVNDIKFLWFRDKAHLLDEPSIDRINSKGNYILENCRFIELRENIKLGERIKGRRQ